MNERTMQAVLMRYAMEEKGHEIAIPNITTIYRWEVDVLSVTRAFLTHEFEIKVSKADYLRDIKKRYKHYCLSTEVLAAHMSPNYFWYVTWGFEIDGPPHYAGWLSVVPHEHGSIGYEVLVRKSAPRIHPLKMSDHTRLKLSRWLSFKLKNMYQNTYLTGAAAKSEL